MEKKWNLQDIKTRPSTARKPVPMMRRQQEAEEPRATQNSDFSNSQQSRNTQPQTAKRVRSRKKRPLLILLVILLCVFGIGWFITYMTGGAIVTIEPRTNKPNVNSEFQAFAIASTSEQLGYEIMTIEATGERQVTSTGQEEVSKAAGGVITIYKNTPGQQRLIKNTRFEGPEGKIFKISESVVVPGASDGTPGTSVIEVYADEAGEEYNLSSGTKFTVPGLKGDETLFNAIYAENKEAFTGGFEGMQYVVSEENLATSQKSIREELRAALLKRLPSEKPADFITFDDAATFSYTSLPATEGTDGNAVLKEKVELKIPLFKNSSFASYIARSVVPGYEGLAVRIQDPQSLDFSYTASSTSEMNLDAVESIQFKLEGRPLIVWEYDATTLETDLLGAQKTALPSILSAYPGIDKAEAKISPFWKSSFPESAAKIEIIEELPE